DDVALLAARRSPVLLILWPSLPVRQYFCPFDRCTARWGERPISHNSDGSTCVSPGAGERPRPCLEGREPMRRVTRNGVIAVAAASGALAVTIPAHAGSAVDGSAAGSPGSISGNAIQLPGHVP